MEETKKDCVKLLNGCVDELCYDVYSNTTNTYIDHFCKIYGSANDCDDKRLENSITATENYDIVGLYENVSSFTADFLNLVGRGDKEAIMPRENVTKIRPN
jgi:hypothetical protein